MCRSNGFTIPQGICTAGDICKYLCVYMYIYTHTYMILRESRRVGKGRTSPELKTEINAFTTNKQCRMTASGPGWDRLTWHHQPDIPTHSASVMHLLLLFILLTRTSLDSSYGRRWFIPQWHGRQLSSPALAGCVRVQQRLVAPEQRAAVSWGQ